MSEITRQNLVDVEAVEVVDLTAEPKAERLSYEAPRVLKRCSIARVTLFSGGGASAGGLTAAG